MIRYRRYSDYIRTIFGERVQKVSVNGGFTCPNRDGSISTGGCTFCSNEAFSPSYACGAKSIVDQIDEGISFQAHRYARSSKFLAYFQAFSNTYATVEELERIYSEALAHPAIVGLVVGTRPDCVDDEKLDLLAHLARRTFVKIEYGVESIYDETLAAVNRGHTYNQAVAAIEATASRQLHMGAHFILGLPGESRAMMVAYADAINALPLDTVKFHQLQIFHNTPMAQQWRDSPADFSFFTLDDYLDLAVDILERLHPQLVVERFAGEAPAQFRAVESWGAVPNERLVQLLDKRLAERDTFQGRLFNI